jgi:hypothetical protein
MSSIRLDGPEGPKQDPAFLLRLLTSAQRESIRLAALQDAANEESGAWQSRVARYTAILTIFAVALYLLGSSLTLRQIRSAFLVVGVSLLVTGMVWAGATAAHPPRRAPDRAADEYADGYVAWYTGIDSSDYRRAAQHFSRAIELRPTFARAYQRRATAIFMSESPHGPGRRRHPADSSALKATHRGVPVAQRVMPRCQRQACQRSSRTASHILTVLQRSAGLLRCVGRNDPGTCRGSSGWV